MAASQVLVVEDEGIIAADIQDRLTALGYEVPLTVSSGEEALEKIPTFLRDVVLMDIMLKGEIDGIDAAAQIRERHNIPVIFLTAHADESTVNRAKLTEPFAYILKPFEERELHTALEMTLHRHQMDQERRKEQDKKGEELEKAVEGSIRTLSRILLVAEAPSHEVGLKLREYMEACTESMKIPNPWDYHVAAELCRIGYLNIQSMIIQKIRAGMTLLPAEKDMFNRLPEYGRDILGRIPRLEEAARMVYYQNKNFDGTGFPRDSIGGVNIPLGARLLRILNDVIQVESEGGSKNRAMLDIQKTSGIYDPKVVEQVMTAFSQGPRKGKAVALKDLYVGQTLVEPIETIDGTLVLNAGNRITPWMLQKLNNFVEASGVKEPIYVE
ncbi:MAG: response regulator [Verrucomicrobia bacterium]|nr:response regulator [Verrucomicrobiota bacterium]